MGSGPVVVGKEWWWWVVRYSRRDRDDLLFDCAHGEFMKCLEKGKWKNMEKGRNKLEREAPWMYSITFPQTVSRDEGGMAEW